MDLDNNTVESDASNKINNLLCLLKTLYGIRFSKVDNIFKSFENEYQAILIHSSDDKRIIDDAGFICNQAGDIVGKVSANVVDVSIRKVFTSNEYKEKKNESSYENFISSTQEESYFGFLIIRYMLVEDEVKGFVICHHMEDKIMDFLLEKLSLYKQKGIDNIRLSCWHNFKELCDGTNPIMLNKIANYSEEGQQIRTLINNLQRFPGEVGKLLNKKIISIYYYYGQNFTFKLFPTTEEKFELLIHAKHDLTSDRNIIDEIFALLGVVSCIHIENYEINNSTDTNVSSASNISETEIWCAKYFKYYEALLTDQRKIFLEAFEYFNQSYKHTDYATCIWELNKVCEFCYKNKTLFVPSFKKLKNDTKDEWFKNLKYIRKLASHGKHENNLKISDKKLINERNQHIRARLKEEYINILLKIRDILLHALEKHALKENN